MKKKESWHRALAGISLFLPISLGCYCKDESRCHRSILKQLIAEEANRKRSGFIELKHGQSPVDLMRYASPVCFADFDKETDI